MSTAVDELRPVLPTSVVAPLVLPRVNLLPPGPAQRARFRRIQMGLGAGLLALVGVVVVLHAEARSDEREAGVDLRAAADEGAVLQREVSSLSDVAAVHDEAARAQAVLAQAMGQEVRYSRVLHDLSRTVPDDVWLESVTFSQVAPAAGTDTSGAAAPVGSTAIGSVSFAGVALAHGDVATWLEALAGQAGFASPTFTEATTGPLGERTAVTFTSTVSLTSAALSGRYAPTAGG